MATIKFTHNLQALLLRAATEGKLSESPFGERDGQPFVRFDALDLSTADGRPRLTFLFKGDEVVTFDGEASGMTTHFNGMTGTFDFSIL